MSRPRLLVAVAALVTAVALVGVAAPTSASTGAEAAPVLRADYRFQNTLASSVPGAPRLLNIVGAGNVRNSFIQAGSRRVLRFPEGNGLRLDNATSVIPRGNYTIAIRFRLNAVESYARVVNFKGDGPDTGLYVNGRDLELYDLDTVDNDTIAANTWVDVVLTRNSATRRVRGYVNGAPQFNLADPNGYGVMSVANVLRFFRDNANREESAGAVARIRLWNGPLTPTQVAAL